jgi:hypothetical protein
MMTILIPVIVGGSIGLTVASIPIAGRTGEAASDVLAAFCERPTVVGNAICSKEKLRADLQGLSKTRPLTEAASRAR